MNLVKEALQLLKPDVRDRRECEADIRQALAVIDMEERNARAVKLPKAERLALVALRAALVRAQSIRSLPIELRLLSNNDAARIRMIDKLLAQPARPAQPDGRRQRLAVREAAALLVDYGRPATTTRGGPWATLAAILYGDPERDLSHHCRQRRSGLKKVPVRR